MKVEDLELRVNRLNELIAQVRSEAGHFKTETSLEDYSNPFSNFADEVERDFREFKKTLTDCVVGLYLKDYNFDYRYDEFREGIDFDKEFTLQSVMVKVMGKIAQKEKLALTTIHDKAQKLVPYRVLREGKVEDILHKSILRLEVGIDTFLSEAKIDYSDYPNLPVFDMFCRVVLWNAKPSEVKTDGVWWVLQQKRGLELTKEKHIIFGSPIATVKFFKNSRADFEFQSPEQAEKVGVALLGKLPEM